MTPLETALGIEPPVSVTVGFERVEIKPLTLRQLGPFTRAMSDLDGVDLGDLVSLARHTESVVRAVEIATGKPEEWLWTLSVDELVTLAAAVFEVNARFFSQTLAPTITAAMNRISLALAGPESSGG